mmetsp:Transcript_8859/g.19461  ORF Transcript_8859/g.19461 Transcript_8859/m.19461 type:complete len:200 (-) Transcript_8859:13-612(-)
MDDLHALALKLFHLGLVDKHFPNGDRVWVAFDLDAPPLTLGDRAKAGNAVRRGLDTGKHQVGTVEDKLRHLRKDCELRHDIRVLPQCRQGREEVAIHIEEGGRPIAACVEQRSIVQLQNFDLALRQQLVQNLVIQRCKLLDELALQRLEVLLREQILVHHRKLFLVHATGPGRTPARRSIRLPRPRRTRLAPSKKAPRT